MSAFIVSQDHIRYLITAAYDYTRGGYISFHHQGERLEYTEPNELGRMLWDENAASVNYRYDETYAPDGYLHRRSPVPITSVQVLKAIACYRYQSCEHDAWDTSAAKSFTTWLTHEAHQHMPGYDEAAWEIDDSEYAQTVARKRAEIAARLAAK